MTQRVGRDVVSVVPTTDNVGGGGGGGGGLQAGSMRKARGINVRIVRAFVAQACPRGRAPPCLASVEVELLVSVFIAASRGTARRRTTSFVRFLPWCVHRECELVALGLGRYNAVTAA